MIFTGCQINASRKATLEFNRERWYTSNYGTYRFKNDSRFPGGLSI